jgi:hypothetical protein
MKSLSGYSMDLSDLSMHAYVPAKLLGYAFG